jgi:simple sugar transport system ATP-binding protein
LKIEDLEAIDDRGLPALKGVAFDVCAFEILGIAGVEGNGQTELVEVLTGLRKATEGKILVDNNDITKTSSGERLVKG